MGWLLPYVIGYACGVTTTFLVSVAAARWAIRTIRTSVAAEHHQ